MALLSANLKVIHPLILYNFSNGRARDIDGHAYYMSRLGRFECLLHILIESIVFEFRGRHEFLKRYYFLPFGG